VKSEESETIENNKIGKRSRAAEIQTEKVKPA
jgi:hypothetical protein